MKSGISNIAIYIPPLYLSHDDLADARSVPRDKFRIGLGNNNMAIVPRWEDTVTIAANAAEMVIRDAGIEKDEIGLLVVSTETGVDQSKPVASFVQGLLGIGPRSRVYEIKHACYGGVPAIMNAVYWVKSGENGGRKALVITSDVATYGFNTPGEPTQGAGSVALIISEETRLFHLLPSLNVFYSEDVFDFWRPNDHRVPIVDGKYSIECYLKALKFCAGELQEKVIRQTGRSLLDYFDYIIYHLPFARMSYKAHHYLISTLNPGLSEIELEELFEESFEKKVKPTLRGAKEVGNIYTGSVYMGLISLMDEKGKDLEGKTVGIFSYGSGCGAEFFPLHIGKGIREQIKYLNFRKQLERRRKITSEEYADLYAESNGSKPIKPEDISRNKTEFSRYFFVGIENHKRGYVRG